MRKGGLIAITTFFLTFILFGIFCEGFTTLPRIGATAIASDGMTVLVGVLWRARPSGLPTDAHPENTPRYLGDRTDPDAR